MWIDVPIFPPRDELEDEKVEDTPTGIRFKPSLKARVQEIAKAERRSFPQTVFKLLQAGIKAYEEEQSSVRKH
jgi:predicted transcriptional regulator